MKEDFPPLLEPGLHDCLREELAAIFVHPFPGSTRRPYLLQRFQLLLDELLQIGITYEIWIDGSFCTKKPEPDDIDIAVFLNASQIASLDSSRQDMLNQIFGNENRAITKHRYGCDAYIIPDHNVEMRSYWRDGLDLIGTNRLKALHDYLW